MIIERREGFDGVSIGEDEWQAAGLHRLGAGHQMQNGRLALFITFHVAFVDAVEHRRARREVKRHVIVQCAAGRQRDACGGSPVLDGLMGDVDVWDVPAGEHGVGHQAARLQNRAQIAQVGDMINWGHTRES